MRREERVGAVIETERLRLHPMRLDDAEQWHARIFADPEVTKYLPPGASLPIERVREAVPRGWQHWEEHGYGLWAVEDGRDGTFLGHCGLRRIDDIGEVEVLYAFASDAWGRGIATEAAQAALAFGFERAGLERIVAFAMPENRGSTRVLEKVGMRYEGEQRIFDLDTVRYGLSREEFLSGGWLSSSPPDREASWPAFNNRAGRGARSSP